MNRREFIEVSGASLVVASTGKLEALAPEDGKTDLPVAAETAPHRPGEYDRA